MTSYPVPIRFSLAEKQALRDEADKNNSSLSQTVKALLKPFFEKNLKKSKVSSLLRLAQDLGINQNDWDKSEKLGEDFRKNFKLVDSK